MYMQTGTARKYYHIHNRDIANTSTKREKLVINGDDIRKNQYWFITNLKSASRNCIQ
jgi:hypothetical protein